MLSDNVSPHRTGAGERCSSAWRCYGFRFSGDRQEAESAQETQNIEPIRAVMPQASLQKKRNTAGSNMESYQFVSIFVIGLRFNRFDDLAHQVR
jgi:hypothetical protein